MAKRARLARRKQHAAARVRTFLERSGNIFSDSNWDELWKLVRKLDRWLAC